MRFQKPPCLLGSGDLLVTFVNSGDVLVAFGCYVWLHVLFCPPSGDFLVSLWVHAWLFCWFCPPLFKLMFSRTFWGISQCLFALEILSATFCIKNRLRLGPDDFLATWGIERGFFSLCMRPARACCLADLLVCLPFNPIRVSVNPPHKTSPSSGQMPNKRDRKFASPHPR